jgi:hypothetical protein
MLGVRILGDWGEGEHEDDGQLLVALPSLVNPMVQCLMRQHYPYIQSRCPEPGVRLAD